MEGDMQGTRVTLQNLNHLASELHETEYYIGLKLERFSRTSQKKILCFTQVVKSL